jgi:hypothetical protein
MYEIVLGQKYLLKKRYKRSFGRKLDLKNPTTLTEKMQWLKLYSRNDLYTTCADKYRVREYFKENFGGEYLIPLLFQTEKYQELTAENITTYPCIVKANHGSGWYKILWDKDSVDWAELQQECKRWLGINYYYLSLEWQYKNIKPCIIVEKLLLDKDGKIPSDYKLNFINGELEFIYCCADRYDGQYRINYTPSWEKLDFTWQTKRFKSAEGKPDIAKPANFDKMVEIGTKIAKDYKYVRIDFYDVDGVLYYGEITLNHGSGLYRFDPESYDRYYGEKLKLD